MKNQLIELAVRSRKKSIGIAEFLKMKETAVKSLVRLPGIGPEHEFEPINNIPDQSEKVYIGGSRYKSFWSFVGASFNYRFISNLIKFLKMCDLITGVFLKPEDKNFDWVSFANKKNIVEIAILRPKGINKKQFFEERSKFLSQLDNENEIVKSHPFRTKFGFFNTDVIVHFTVFKSKESYEKFSNRTKSLTYFNDFLSKSEPLLISFCTMTK